VFGFVVLAVELKRGTVVGFDVLEIQAVFARDYCRSGGNAVAGDSSGPGPQRGGGRTKRLMRGFVFRMLMVLRAAAMAEQGDGQLGVVTVDNERWRILSR
jgi:hypothetical protein